MKGDLHRLGNPSVRPRLTGQRQDGCADRSLTALRGVAANRWSGSARQFVFYPYAASPGKRAGLTLSIGRAGSGSLRPALPPPSGPSLDNAWQVPRRMR